MKGAYILAGAEDPEIVLIGAGSEVSLVAAAHEKLVEAGVRSQLVSMPSWYLFEKQDQAYKDKVLPANVTKRLAIEMGSEVGWDRYVGLAGRTITMHSFGASAPIAKLQDKFGFTVDNVIKVAREAMATEKRR